ncbi:MAG TPA: hypothetical protein VFP84_16460 [Kofleriaceae bacterium]|nr:hypothetical protein [Kofleriaceae bacterium]
MKLRIAAAAVLAASACQAELDTTRTPDSYSSFGDAIYREACQRVAYTGQLAQQQAGTLARVDVSGSLGRAVCVMGEAPPAGAPVELVALSGEHAGITTTVDGLLPQPFLATLETFLERILPLYDDGTMENAIASLAKLLGAMHDDPAFTAAFARIRARRGYQPLDLASGAIHEVLAYPDFDAFTGSFLGLVGPGGAGQPAWEALVAAGGATFGTAVPEVDPADPDRTLKLGLDLAFAQDPSAEHALTAGTPYLTVVRDVRGVAVVATNPDGSLVAPFADTNHDGLADIDDFGRFLGADGKPLAVPTPFPVLGQSDSGARDSLGRALVAPGALETLYQYRDLDGTMLIGALREAPTILDPAKDTALGLAWGATALLGPRATQTRTYTDHAGAPIGSITYNGFDTTGGKSPALDLIHGFVTLLGAPDIDEVLQTANTLVTQQEAASSRAIGAMLDASDRGKAHAEAQLPAASTLYDDLAPLIARVLRDPALVDDLLVALQDPHVQGVAPMIGRMAQLANQLDFNHSSATNAAGVKGAPDFDLINSFDPPQPVDRAQPDVDYNRSVLQRIAHLIHDSNGLRFCNKPNARAVEINAGKVFDACKLFDIEDVALFFALNIASPDVILATKDDPVRFATTYSKASFREQIVDPTFQGLVPDGPLGDTELQGLIGITDFVRFPTPKALARALFLDVNKDSGVSNFLRETTTPLVCKDGDRFIDVHNKSIFAWELAMPAGSPGVANDTFYDAVRPLIDAFAKHDECAQFDDAHNCVKRQNAVKIFIDLLSVLHEHDGSPRSSYFGHTYQHADRAQPRFAFPDNAVSFEPLLVELFGSGAGAAGVPGTDLVPSLLAFAPVLQTLTIDGLATSKRALPVLTAALQYVFDPALATHVAYRDGRTQATQSDGTTPAGPVTPFFVLGDAFRAKRAVLDGLAATPDGARQAARWRAATSALVDQVLAVDHPSATTWQFHNRRFNAITQILISFVRDRIQRHAARGDLDAWAHHDLMQDIADKLTGPVIPPLGDLAAQLEHDDAARAQFYGLLAYLVDEPGHPQTFRTGLTLLADTAQQLLDDRDLVPVSRVIGKAMDPAFGGVVNAEVALIKKSHAVDGDQVLLTLLRKLFNPGDGANGGQLISDLTDLISAVDRVTPGQPGDLDGADEASVLGALRDFFGDNQRGFLRFVQIVQNRNGKPAAPAASK